MPLSSSGPCSRPCLSNSIPPGATLPAGFSFRPGGGPPLLGRFAALLPSSGPLCVSPPWWLCAAFSFSGCKFTRFYFSFVLLPSCASVWRLRPLRFRVWRFPWPSAGRSGGGGACISGLQCSRLGLPGPSWAVRVQAWPEAFRACSAGACRFFARVCPDRSAGASGGASACAKVAEAKSMRERPKVAALRCSLIVAIVVEC